MISSCGFDSTFHSAQNSAYKMCTKTQHFAEADKVNLNALGDTLVENLLAESMYLSYVDQKYGAFPLPEKVPVTLPDEKEWQFDYEKDGIMVFKEKKLHAKLHSFATRGVVSSPYTHVSEFVKDPQSTFVWDSFLVEAKYLKTYTETSTCQDYLGYQLHSATQCFSLIQRDLLYFVRCQYKGGKFVMAGVSIEDKDYPPQKAVPRCEMHMGSGFVVEPFRGSSSSSLVTYLAKGDIKGVPQLITAQVVRRHSMAIKYIKRSMEYQPLLEHTQTSQQECSPFKDSSFHSMCAYEESNPLSSFIGKNKQS